MVNKQVRLLCMLVKHPQVPWPAKITGACAIGYLFSPIQLIPSFLPILGQMDDLLVLYLGIRMVRKFAPEVVLNQCEALAEGASSAEIDRWERRLRDGVMARSLQIAGFGGRRRFVQNSACAAEIGGFHQQLNPTEQIGDEPVHAHHVFVCEETFDAAGIQLSFRKQRLRDIPKTPEKNQVSCAENASFRG